MPWQLQADYSHEQIESRESFRSKSGPHSKPFERDERVSIDFDGLWLELFQLLQAGLGSDYSSRWCPYISFNCTLIICIEQHWEKVQGYRMFASKDDIITECKKIILFLMLLNFLWFPAQWHKFCIWDIIHHTIPGVGDCTGQVCWNADGQKSTGNTVHIRIISVTIQA